MKERRALARFSLFAVCFLAAAAQGTTTISLTNESTQRVQVELDVALPAVRTVRQAGRKYSRVEIDGIYNDEDEGAPSLPKLSRFIAVPDGTSAEIESLTTNKESPLHLDHALSYAEGRRHCGTECRSPGPNAKAFAASWDLPYASISSTSYMGPVRAALLTFAPVQRHDGRELRVARHIGVRIRFVTNGRAAVANTPVSTDGIHEDDARLFQSLTLNHPSPPASFRALDGKKTDLIIAYASYAGALADLVRFKERQGREVRVKFLDGKPTTAVVKAIIKEQYAAPHPPTHTILVGSIDQIPAYRHVDIWTDYPYALLDKGDFPDLSIARLPAQSDGELKNIIAKIIARETSPRDNAAVLMTSGYETTWCQVNLQFILDNIFSRAKVKLATKKLYASDGAGTDAIIDGYNANPNFIVYDGHGNATGMTEIPLGIEHLARLKNTVFPLVFDIACLNSYWPAQGASPRNFSESLVTLQGAGAAGILAASGNSGGHDLFRHVFRGAVFDEAAAENPYHGLNEVGSAVLYGKLKYLEQFSGGASALTDNKLFFYHGDPASSIFQ